MECIVPIMVQSDDSRYDLDPTPKAGAGFRFTPSLLDPTSSAFAAFAAQPPCYYTPTPGGSNLGFQTYDLALNSHAFNTPDSLSHPNPNPLSATNSIFHQPLNTLDHGNYIHFGRPHPYTPDSYQNLSIPGKIVGGAASESSSSNYSPETASATENTDQEIYLATAMPSKFMGATAAKNQDLYGEYFSHIIQLLTLSFRFATTLHAATAMLRHHSDIPVTYLNKRQAYTVSVVDTAPPVQNNELRRYRTTLRIAFDEEFQRSTAPACWRLWKDGRGTLESGGNPDKLRAIDYGTHLLKHLANYRTC
jgi:CP2 transcription factor